MLQPEKGVCFRWFLSNGSWHRSSSAELMHQPKGIRGCSAPRDGLQPALGLLANNFPWMACPERLLRCFLGFTTPNPPVHPEVITASVLPGFVSAPGKSTFLWVLLSLHRLVVQAPSNYQQHLLSLWKRFIWQMYSSPHPSGDVAFAATPLHISDTFLQRVSWEICLCMAGASLL